jgi:hypothetical protein
MARGGDITVTGKLLLRTRRKWRIEEHDHEE